MAYVMYVDVKPVEGEKIRQQLSFFGETEHVCQEEYDALCGRCEWLSEKRKAGHTDETVSEIGNFDWPDYGVHGYIGDPDDDEEADDEGEDEEEDEDSE